MLNKFIKRGQRKVPKSEAIEPPISNPQPSVTVNHASRSVVGPSGSNSNSQLVSVSAPPTSGVVEILPMLKDVPLIDRHVVFIRKLQICCFTFDFSDPLKSAREKEIKRQTLAELIELVRTGWCKLNETLQEELVRMISVNIFRCLPPATHENSATEIDEPDEDDAVFEPSWIHLQLVYELLLRYVVSTELDTKVAKRYIDHSFVVKLLNLFDSENPLERVYLKTILHRIYEKFMVHRPFIRKAINNIFYRFIFETERHSGIVELLEILGSIINGFLLPMKGEHKLFLVRALIPLHKPKCVASYHQQLSSCIIQFVEKDYKLADTVIMGLLKYWPVTNCGKEVLFLGELKEVLEAMLPEEFQRCMVPLFRQIRRCLISPHFQVAERALYLWNNEHIVGLIAQNRQVILPLIFEALGKNIEGHWNQAVQGLTVNVRKMFLDMDAELFEECDQQYAEREARSRELEEQRELKWKRLEEVAAQAGDDMVIG